MNNCTTYLLQATESQCPVDKSGTSTDYTCELNTTYGARANKILKVTYFRVGKHLFGYCTCFLAVVDRFSNHLRKSVVLDLEYSIEVSTFA